MTFVTFAVVQVDGGRQYWCSGTVTYPHDVPCPLINDK